jgi:hypothetical protein
MNAERRCVCVWVWVGVWAYSYRRTKAVCYCWVGGLGKEKTIVSDCKTTLVAAPLSGNNGGC